MRRLLLVVLTLGFFSTLAHAQTVSLYFTSVNTRFSNVENGQALNTTTSTYTNLFTTSWPSQFGGGLTLNAPFPGPVKLGLDFRGSTNHGTTGADTAMFGPRLAVRAPILHIKPYIAAEGGYVATRTVGTVAATIGGAASTSPANITNQYAAWEIFGGIDYPLISHVDFRVIEIGGGKGYLANAGVSNINFNNTNTQISLFSIDTGVVVHF